MGRKRVQGSGFRRERGDFNYETREKYERGNEEIVQSGV